MFPELFLPPLDLRSSSSTTRSGGCPAAVRLRPAQLARGFQQHDLRPLATKDSHTLGQGFGPHAHLPEARERFPGRSSGSSTLRELPTAKFRMAAELGDPASPDSPSQTSVLHSESLPREAAATPALSPPPPPRPVTAAAPGPGPPLLQHLLTTGAGGWASYQAAGHGEARQRTASSATPGGCQPGSAGPSAWAAGASPLAAPPPPLPPPSHNHNNMAAAATQSALPRPIRAESGGARARSGAQSAVRWGEWAGRHGMARAGPGA